MNSTKGVETNKNIVEQDEIALTHCYFLLGMLFEKIRSESLYRQVHPMFLLHNAYRLLSEIEQAPEILSIWQYLVGTKITSIKEQKKIQQLFCIIAAMQQIGQKNSIITVQELQKYFISQTKHYLPEDESLTISLKTSPSVSVLFGISEHINSILQSQKNLRKVPMLAEFLSTVAISFNGLLPYPYLHIELQKDESGEYSELTYGNISKALEQCTFMFDQLKQMEHIHKKRISSLGRVATSAEKLYQHLLKKPVITTKDVQRILGLAKPNALLMIDRFIEIGILSQINTSERNRIYGNYDLLKIFNLQKAL